MGLFNKLKNLINEADNKEEEKSKILEEKNSFQVTGTNYKQDEIKSILKRNSNYDLPKSKIKEDVYEYNGLITSDVVLKEEPTNPYDPNAITVICKGVLVGYIKKGSTSRVKNLMKLPHRIEIQFYGGNVKGWYDTEFINNKKNIECKIYIYTQKEL